MSKEVNCPTCKDNKNVVKLGATYTGVRRFGCKKCKKSFNEPKVDVSVESKLNNICDELVNNKLPTLKELDDEIENLEKELGKDEIDKIKEEMESSNIESVLLNRVKEILNKTRLTQEVKDDITRIIYEGVKKDLTDVEIAKRIDDKYYKPKDFVLPVEK